MWSTSSRFAQQQWVKYLGRGELWRHHEELRAHLGAKALTNGLSKLPLLSTPSQTAEIKLCNTILSTHLCNLEVLRSSKTKIEIHFYNTTHPCISPAHFQACQTGKFCLICTEKPHSSEPNNWDVTWKDPEDLQPTGSGRHRYLRIPAILIAVFSHQKHTPPRLKTRVCKYSPQFSLK